ncbi:MAG: ATP-binding cassette domain-containing protein [Bacteroidota bacterium]
MYKSLKQVFWLVWPFLWKDSATRSATSYSVAIVLLNTLAHTAAIWLFGYLLKQYKVLSLVAILLAIAAWVLCWCARVVLDHVREIVFFRVINQAIRDIRLRVIMHLHQVPLQAWSNYGVTEIISANARVSQSIRSFMSITFIKILPALVKMGSFSIAMLHIHRSAWYFLLSVVLTYGYAYVGIRRFLQSRRHLWEATDQARTAMNDSLRNTKFSQFHLKTEESRLATFLDAEAQNWWHNNFQLHKIHLVQGALFAVMAGGLVTHLVFLLRSDQLTIPDFVVIEGYIFSIYSQLQGITSRIRGLLGSLVDLGKVLDLLSLPIRSADASLSSVHVEAITPILQVRNVSFAYAQQNTAVLQDISIDIQRGDQVAITGPSGIGKSTLCHLLAGIYLPQQGDILLYGTSLQRLPLATIGQYVHFVSQEATLINGTIADNLKPNLSPNQTMPLTYLKDRLHYATGDGGKRLSGGERQRVLLARCLSYQPEVLILDEALNALDEASAQELLQLILQTVPTVILVTHRKSLVQKLKQHYCLATKQLKAA